MYLILIMYLYTLLVLFLLSMQTNIYKKKQTESSVTDFKY